MRELLILAENAEKARWNHTSSLLAMMFNLNRDPKKHRPVTPETFNPYATRKVKKDNQMAFDAMKAIWVKDKK